MHGARGWLNLRVIGLVGLEVLITVIDLGDEVSDSMGFSLSGAFEFVFMRIFSSCICEPVIYKFNK